jgi:hypothetical protein
MATEVTNPLDMPLAELQLHGVRVQAIEALELKFGLYVRNIVFKRGEQLLTASNFGDGDLISVRRAVRKVLSSNQ